MAVFIERGEIRDLRLKVKVLTVFRACKTRDTAGVLPLTNDSATYWVSIHFRWVTIEVANTTIVTSQPL